MPSPPRVQEELGAAAGFLLLSGIILALCVLPLLLMRASSLTKPRAFGGVLTAKPRIMPITWLLGPADASGRGIEQFHISFPHSFSCRAMEVSGELSSRKESTVSVPSESQPTPVQITVLKAQDLVKRF